MAFDIRNLGVISYTLGFTQWHYKSNNDNITEITQDGYFNDTPRICFPLAI